MKEEFKELDEGRDPAVNKQKFKSTVEYLADRSVAYLFFWLVLKERALAKYFFISYQFAVWPDSLLQNFVLSIKSCLFSQDPDRKLQSNFMIQSNLTVM